MRKLLFSGALAVSSMMAAPVLAGDQPVFVTGGPVYKDGEVVIYRFDTVNGTVGGANELAVSGGRVASAGTDGPSNAVGPTSLSRSDSTALYARLMAEARERGLK